MTPDSRHLTTPDDQGRPSPSARENAVPYDRTVLVEVLVYHYRADLKGCGCGWAELGRSWPEHVATVYEESVLARENAARS